MTLRVKTINAKPAVTRQQDQEVVHDGLQGCLQIASKLAYRYYRYQLVLPEDRQQAAALAALEAYSNKTREFTLREITKAIRAVLYRQAKAYGYRMVNTRRQDGSRTSGWANCEIPFSLLPTSYKRVLGLAGYVQSRKEEVAL